MPNPVIDNFDLKAEKFNFERDCFDTLAKMKAFPEAGVPDQFSTFCLETKKAYRIDKSNDVDSITGKWRELNIGEIKTLTSLELSNPELTEGLYIATISGVNVLIYVCNSNGSISQVKLASTPSFRYYSNGAWSSWDYTIVTQIKVGGMFLSKSKGTVDLGNIVSAIKQGATTYNPNGGIVTLPETYSKTEANEKFIENPSGGSAGQVLTMTDTGTEWKTPTSGDGSTPGTGEGLTEAQKTFLGVSGDLQTESKVSLPSAINEVAGEVQKVWNKMGNELIAEYVVDINKVLYIASVDYNTATFTFTEKHGYVTAPHFYGHCIICVYNKYISDIPNTIKELNNSGNRVRILEVIDEYTLRLGVNVDLSNWAITQSDYDFTKFHIEICTGVIKFEIASKTTDIVIEYTGKGLFGQPYINFVTPEGSTGSTPWGMSDVNGYNHPYYAKRRATIYGNSIVQHERRSIVTKKTESINELITDSIQATRFTRIDINNNYPAFPNGTTIKIYNYDSGNN